MGRDSGEAVASSEATSDDPPGWPSAVRNVRMPCNGTGAALGGGGVSARAVSARAAVAGAVAAGVAGGALAWWGAVRRRTEPAPAEGELAATREMLERMLGNLTEAVTVTDRDRRMRYANQAAADVLGYATPEELIVQPLGAVAARWDSTHEDGRPLTAEDVPSYKIVNGLPAEPLLTKIIHRETGELRWRLVKAAPLEGPAGEIMAVSVIEDVTEAKEAEVHQRFLAEAGEALASSLDYEETLQLVARLTVPELADWCAVDVLDASGRPHLVAVAHVDPQKVAFARDFRRRYPSDPREDRGFYKVVRTGEPELYPVIPDELLEQTITDPEQLAAIRDVGMRSVMIVPMVVAGRSIGAISFISAESGRSFDEEDLAFAGELARRAAVAVENSRLYTERAQTALTLQQTLLPERLPSIPGWQLASAYAAGDTTTDVGGDFYDVVTLEGGLMAIVGDVTGKGVAAAALTSLARYTLATAARFDPSPPSVVALLNDVLIAREDLSLVTVACARLVPTASGARMHLTGAGHPAPVLVRAGHPPITVGTPGLLLGMSSHAHWEETVVDLAPGDAVLFYTDGVTDTPSGAERFGERRLLEVLSGPPADPAAMIERVQRAIRAFQVGDVVDDRAMLALQLVGVWSATGQSAARRDPESSVL
jgi:PAS domain S-box-containing protein